MFCFVSFDQANVVKWEKAVNDDEKELEKVRNDEQRHMKVMLYINNASLDLYYILTHLAHRANSKKRVISNDIVTVLNAWKARTS